MRKKEVRLKMQQARDNMSTSDRQRQNQEIRNQLLQWEHWKNAKWIFPFVSFGTEVDTVELIRQILREEQERERLNGKRSRFLAVPKVEGREINFYQIDTIEQLRPGYQGILEPSGGCMITASSGIMLMPGLAFDKRKTRVGYGGGYYDRYLSRHGNSALVTAALAFDFQVVESIEGEAFDVSPEYIVTPDGIW